MSTYVIGDVQGCYAALETLLTRINFDASNDTLWFAGDIVNRGPQSLEVLRFIKQLGDKHIIVLGNHDLHLLAVAYGVREKAKHDTLDAVLAAPDRDDLMNWLRQRPLLYYDKQINFALAHAGIASCWTIEQALMLADEVKKALHEQPRESLQHLFGNEPAEWRDELTGMQRLRCIVNYLTRMRFCHHDGRLELAYKGKLNDKPEHLTPWFNIHNRKNANINIVFGHWAALGGETHTPHVFAIDTGCAWGHCLTAMRLEDQQRFSVTC